MTAVADSLAASGQAAQQPVNPIVSALQGQGMLYRSHSPHAPGLGLTYTVLDRTRMSSSEWTGAGGLQSVARGL